MFDKIKTIKINPEISAENGVCVAVGMFDGVHLGHRAMLGRLIQESKRVNLPSAVFTFDIEDNPKNESKLLTLSDKKIELFADLGIDIVFSAAFSDIRMLSADDFVNNVLFGMLSARSVVCGYDFRFGNDRLGDVELIKKLLSPKGVSVITQEAVLKNCKPVSSTLIRSLIANGDVANANELLGHTFSFKNEIVHGKKLGRTLGFPTINQAFPSRLATPRFGVYAVRCNINGQFFCGVANIGVKPTVSDDGDIICETYLFDYSGDCYGCVAETEFLEFIREEKRFLSLDELKSQIECDKETAINILNERGMK